MRRSFRVSMAAFAVTMIAASAALASTSPDVGPYSGTRYASDAYPGFDNGDEVAKPERKEPKWFSFWNGPDRDTASEQYDYCRGLIALGECDKAVKQLDALVREWPTSPEAPKAQRGMADLLLEKTLDYIEAFDAYRYLTDFYSSSCNYNEVVDRMYRTAQLMEEDGKRIFFVRFSNTADVRRAYEACVVRAPGAGWVRKAMLKIGELRIDEGKHEEAIKVYENLRNLHYGTDDALEGLLREGDARMVVLRDLGYNRDRCRDTIDFLKLALKICRKADKEKFEAWLVEAKTLIEDETWLAVSFYDSKMRTKRSAINAYERYLSEYPDGVHAEEARARLEELKSTHKGDDRVQADEPTQDGKPTQDDNQTKGEEK